MNPRKLIIKEFRSSDVPIDVNKLRAKYTVELSQENLFEYPLLSHTEDLTLIEIQLLIKFYGSGFLFHSGIEETVPDMIETSKEREEIEKRELKELYGMNKIVFTGWRAGFQKVSFIKLLQNKAGLGLKEAKDCNDLILWNIPITIHIESGELAEEILNEATELGATGKLIRK